MYIFTNSYSNKEKDPQPKWLFAMLYSNLHDIHYFYIIYFYIYKQMTHKSVQILNY